MTRKASTLLLLAVVAALTCTLGVACFFSAPGVTGNTATVSFADSSLGPGWVQTEHVDQPYFQENKGEMVEYENINYFSFDNSPVYVDYDNNKLFKLPETGFSIAIINDGQGWADNFALAFIDFDTYGSAIEINQNSIIILSAGTKLTQADFSWENVSRIDINDTETTITWKSGDKNKIPYAAWASQYLEFRNGASNNCPQISIYYQIDGSPQDMSYITRSVSFYNKVDGDVNLVKTVQYRYVGDVGDIVVADYMTIPEADGKGLVFKGWYTKEGKTPYDPLNGNIAFYAEFEGAKVQIKTPTKTITDFYVPFGTTVGEALDKFFNSYPSATSDYRQMAETNTSASITEDAEIVVNERYRVYLRYFKLERYSVKIKNKTFDYDMLTYKTVNDLVWGGEKIDVLKFDSALYNILDKPYYETMPGFTFTGWDYDINQSTNHRRPHNNSPV